MLRSVLAAVVATRGRRRVFVVTADPSVASLAQARMPRCCAKTGRAGLNAAVRLGIARAAAAAPPSALVLPADIPLGDAGRTQRPDRQRRDRGWPGVHPGAAARQRRHQRHAARAARLPSSPRYGPGSYLRTCRRPWRGASTSRCVHLAGSGPRYRRAPPTSPGCWPTCGAQRYAFLAPARPCHDTPPGRSARDETPMTIPASARPGRDRSRAATVAGRGDGAGRLR